MECIFCWVLHWPANFLSRVNLPDQPEACSCGRVVGLALEQAYIQLCGPIAVGCLVPGSACRKKVRPDVLKLVASPLSQCSGSRQTTPTRFQRTLLVSPSFGSGSNITGQAPKEADPIVKKSMHEFDRQQLVDLNRVVAVSIE